MIVNLYGTAPRLSLPTLLLTVFQVFLGQCFYAESLLNLYILFILIGDNSIQTMLNRFLSEWIGMPFYSSFDPINPFCLVFYF